MNICILFVYPLRNTTWGQILKFPTPSKQNNKMQFYRNSIAMALYRFPISEFTETYLIGSGL